MASGAGFAGRKIREAGVSKIIGIDGSPEMMSLAPEGLYFKKVQCFIGSDPVPSDLLNTVDLVVCTGAMVPSHLPPTVFEIILSMLKTGGAFVFTVSDAIFCKGGEVPYKDIVDDLIEQGKYEFIHRHKFVNYLSGIRSQSGAV